MLNINPGQNLEIVEQCKRLKEYVLYVDRVRKYAKELPIKETVERVVSECIKEDILREFLIKYRKEAIMVSIFQYNEEKTMQYIREDEYSKGVKAGTISGREMGIEALVLDNLEENVEEEKILKKLVKRFSLSEEDAKHYFNKYASNKNE